MGVSSALVPTVQDCAPREGNYLQPAGEGCDSPGRKARPPSAGSGGSLSTPRRKAIYRGPRRRCAGPLVLRLIWAALGRLPLPSVIKMMEFSL